MFVAVFPLSDPQVIQTSKVLGDLFPELKVLTQTSFLSHSEVFLDIYDRAFKNWIGPFSESAFGISGDDFREEWQNHTLHIKVTIPVSEKTLAQKLEAASLLAKIAQDLGVLSYMFLAPGQTPSVLSTKLTAAYPATATSGFRMHPAGTGDGRILRAHGFSIFCGKDIVCPVKESVSQALMDLCVEAERVLKEREAAAPLN